MKILVYDIAAREGGGGAQVLENYFRRAIRDTDHEWWFVVTLPKYLDRACDHVHVVCPDISRGSKPLRYALRKRFELTGLRKLCREVRPDEILSLQNMPAPVSGFSQTVYLHQSFQFAPVRFRFTRPEERSFAVRQRIICPVIRRKLRGADRVIVQTEWMKEAAAAWAKYPPERIRVERPEVSAPENYVRPEREENVFFYPASAYLNKNHRVLLDACRLLKERGIRDYRVDFTFAPDANAIARSLSAEAERDGLPVRFIGHLDRAEVFRRYGAQIMLFPSYVETFGLPLEECKTVGGEVIASDLPFAREVLGSWERATFVPWQEPGRWADAMAERIRTKSPSGEK